MVILCVECFPKWEDEKVYTIVPVSPCVECGRADSRCVGGLITHAFPDDPRVVAEETVAVKVEE